MSIKGADTTQQNLPKVPKITITFDENGNIIYEGLPKDTRESLERLKVAMLKEYPRMEERHAEKYLADMAKGNVIRKMDKEERLFYSDAMVRITNEMPAFRDILTHLRPYLDLTCSTAYVDQYSRLGLGLWWFYDINEHQRSGVLLHEAMHILNDHHIRSEKTGYNDPRITNLAMDMEINTTINSATNIDLPPGTFPDNEPYNFPPRKSFEQYYLMLQDFVDEQEKQQQQEEDEGESDDSGEGSDADENTEEQQGSGNGSGSESSGDQEGSGEGSGQGQSAQGNSQGSGSGSGDSEKTQSDGSDAAGGDDQSQDSSDGDGSDQGKSHTCDTATKEREQAADEAGINKSTTSEQTAMKSRIAQKLREIIQKNRAAGDGHLNEFYQLAYSKMYRPVTDWKTIFKRVSANSMARVSKGRADYSYRQVNRRMTGGKFIFPGMIKYEPSAMLGVDISGSMGKDDQIKTAGEAESLLKALGNNPDFKVFSVDTKVGDIQPVKSVKDIDLYGGGGTRMEVAFQYIQSLPKKQRPDFFVLATDGGTDWDLLLRDALKTHRMKVMSVILVTSEDGMERYNYVKHRYKLPAGLNIIDCSKPAE